MTMSMYSSYTPEDFNNIEEDIFGEYGKHIALAQYTLAIPDRLDVQYSICMYNSL